MFKVGDVLKYKEQYSGGHETTTWTVVNVMKCDYELKNRGRNSVHSSSIVHHYLEPVANLSDDDLWE